MLVRPLDLTQKMPNVVKLSSMIMMDFIVSLRGVIF